MTSTQLRETPKAMECDDDELRRAEIFSRLDSSRLAIVDREGEATVTALTEWLKGHPLLEVWAVKQSDPWLMAFKVWRALTDQ